MTALSVPTPCLVVLVGVSGSGKSTWAAQNCEPGEIVSSDALRAQVGESAFDQQASADAFAVLEDIVQRRLARGLFTVIDATSLEDASRQRYRDFARAAGVTCVAIAFPTDAATCKSRNRARATPVPAPILNKQLKDFARVLPLLDAEGYDSVFHEPAPLRRRAANETALRFGLQLPRHGWEGSRAGALRDVAVAAEDAGFSSMFLMDHFIQIPQAGREWDDILECYTTLGFLAGVTTRVRLGALVTGITYRNVALLGKMIATLDVLSEGRAIAGLGAAWYEREHAAYGFAFPPLRERYALLEDALQLLPLMWGKGAPAFTGRVIEVPEAMSYPRPVQERIPILVGGSGERKTLRLVAQYADACNLFGNAATLRRKLAVLHSHCAAVGRDPSTIEVTHLGTVAPTADPIPHYAGLADAGVHTAIVNFRGEPTAADVAAFGRVIGAFNH
ncbi:MAG TPA: TIGR03560 family F420-dependent LLM class oxidoreductase [Acidimicrobiales bacterium]|nr:TIGR03560 family F420-dependent LLM class oxidoreductase [Acidimicrobiales bacterium]